MGLCVGLMCLEAPTSACALPYLSSCCCADGPAAAGLAAVSSAYPAPAPGEPVGHTVLAWCREDEGTKLDSAG